jgi:hypothetical protein
VPCDFITRLKEHNSLWVFGGEVNGREAAQKGYSMLDTGYSQRKAEETPAKGMLGQGSKNAGGRTNL